MKKTRVKRFMKRVHAFGVSAALLLSGFLGFVPNTKPQEVFAATNYELVSNVQDAAILHCWNWSYQTIMDNLQLIAECGYSAIQTSPATQPKDYMWDGVVGTDVGTPGAGGTGNWWKLYQPVAECVCDNGQTWLGTKAELEQLCAKAHEYGIKVIVDIVANHMGNITGWKNSLTDVSPQVGEYWNPDMLTDESFWHINDLQIWMSDGREHFTQGTMGMPDLNTADKRVQKYIADYLKELIDCGVDGYRFDAAKHIETPDDDPAFASDFWPTVLGAANSHYTAKTGGTLYIYGEILNTVGDNFSIDSYTKYMSVTDNSAGHHMLESVRNGQAGNLSMAYAPNKSVIWAESHDTYMNESSRYASDKSVVRTWAMVANKKDAAALYFVRPYYSKDVLEDDRDGSFRSNLENTLVQAQMGACETYTWASKEVAAINHFRNRMKGVQDNIGSEGSIAYCFRGNGAVLADFNGSGTISIGAHGMANGTYTDEVSGNTFTVSNGVLSGKIESEWGIAVIYQNVMPNPSVSYPVQIKNSVGDGTVFYSDSLNVTIEAVYADNASYSATTGESGSFTGSKTINIGQGLRAGETVTLTVTGTNSKGTVTKTYTYTKDEYDLNDCIFFKNTKGWSGVTAYIWNDTVTPAVNNSGWPGEAMFECDPANGVFALKIDKTAGYTKVIFSNSGASQTDDISIGQIGYMYNPDTGAWTQYRVNEDKPVITASKGSSQLSGPTQVTFTVQNASRATYSLNGGNAVSFTGSVTLTVGQNTKDTVVIYAENAAGSKTATYTYTKAQTPQLKVSATANASSVKVGDTVRLTATASGGTGGYTYKFLVQNVDTNQWSVLRDYAADNAFNWIAGSTGNRNFFVDVKDSSGTVVRSSAINVKTINATVPLSITGKASAANVTVGTNVTFSGTASGGNGNYTYSYIMHNKSTGDWYRFSDFKAVNTLTWTASSAGNREFFVEVKDGAGNVARSSAINVMVTQTTALGITGKASASNANVGASITFTGTASGGNGSYTYSYIMHNKDTGDWYRFSGFQTSNTLTWQATSAGNREFFVEVKDGTGTVVRSSAMNVTVVNTTALSITGRASASNVNVGASVTFTGTASGGSAGYTYSYIMHNKDTGDWYRFSDFTASNTLTWTASSAGNREFFVEVKDRTGKVVRSSAMNVKVNGSVSQALSIKGTASAAQIGVETTIRITGTASGGSGGYTYSFLMHNIDTNAWHRFSDFNTSNVLSWTATSAGNREFFVEVKDSTGKIVRSSGVNVKVTR
ncbi:MAG: starch-binding protein [Lachnospiraceae bacterium]|nr:starch-binding protein [Lachnospiraceae bacterium]